MPSPACSSEVPALEITTRPARSGSALIAASMSTSARGERQMLPWQRVRIRNILGA
jgi:hypothetical protein